jgi:chemotaxis protein CheX
MDMKLISPFIDATLNVLETMSSTKVQTGKPYVKNDRVARGDVSGVIGLTGKVSGTMSASFTEKSILSIVSNMVGEEMKEMNDEIRDAVGEITNMISGHARTKLAHLGRSLTATIPLVIMGKNHIITHITTYPIFAIPFTTTNGDFTVEVCFEE